MHVFISYSRHDKDFVQELVDTLRTHNIEIWRDMDSLYTGERWIPQIDEGLDNCYTIIVVLSPSSIQSRWVTYELAYAWGQKKKLIPLIVEPVDNQELFGFQGMPFTHGTRNWARLIEELEKAQSLSTPSSFSIPHDAPQIIREAAKLIENSPIQSEREQGLNTLRQMLNNPIALDLLHQSMQHGTNDVRIGAVRIFGGINNQDAVDALIQALKDISYEVRSEAIRALHQNGGALQALSDIAAILRDDPVYYTRIEAAKVLCKYRNRPIVDEALEAAAKSDPVVLVQRAALCETILLDIWSA